MKQNQPSKNTSRNLNENEENIEESNSSNSLEIKISKENLKKQKKRHRRGKSISDPRNFICPECYRNYLSASALKNHRRMKHDFGVEYTKKGRGRPKKEFLEDEYISKMDKEYNNFIESKKIKKENNNDNIFNLYNILSLKEIKEVFEEMYKLYKKDLFDDVSNIEKNVFYELIKENWEKKLEQINLENKSYYSMINCTPNVTIVNKPPIDVIFFQYLKQISNVIEKSYSIFILKFIIILRQYINKEKKNSININIVNEKEKKCDYTQIYDASVVPDFFNDFLVNFMEKRDYFNLNKDEVINFTQYFCFWMFKQGYTESHLSKIE